MCVFWLNLNKCCIQTYKQIYASIKSHAAFTVAQTIHIIHKKIYHENKIKFQIIFFFCFFVIFVLILWNLFVGRVCTHSHSYLIFNYYLSVISFICIRGVLWTVTHDFRSLEPMKIMCQKNNTRNVSMESMESM